MKNDGLKRGLWMIGILMVAVIILQSLILWTNITGYTIVDFGNYSSEIGLNYTTNSSYIWEVPEEGILTSLKLSGYVAGDSASVYLGDDLVYMSSVAENSLVSVANGSGEIELNFSYGSNLGYDNNNDGVAFISDVIDFFVNASFDFNVSYDNLCTKYVVNNLDDNLTYPVCYGSLSCCDFLNLESLGNWSDSLLLNYGKYSSGYNNTVDATLIYYDVNLSVPYSNIYNSETLRLDANFVDAVEFELECEDTCLGLNYSNSSYSLDIVVDGLLHISNVSYSLGNESDDNSTNVTEDPFGDAGTLDYPDSSINVTCGDALDTAGTYYTLNESVSGYVGTCFNIIADDVVLDGNGFMIDGDDSGTDYGVNASGKDNITIKNFANVTDFSEAVYLDNTNNSLIENVTVKSNTGYGVHLKSSSDNTLTNNIANSNALWGINIDSNSNNNQLINNTANLNSWFGVTITSSSNNTILNLESYQNSLNEIDWTSGTGNKIIYNNSYGEIAFIDQIDYDLEGDLRFGPGYNIEIGNNSVYLNSTNLTSLNKSANITLNLADWSFTNPEIKKDGIACSDCYNFTSLSASTVVFNVSSWSNYSVGEVVDPFSLTDCGVLGSAGTYTLQNNLTGISGSCFNITAADVVLNGKGFVIDGDSTGEDYGVYTNGSNNLTIKNFGNIKDFIRGVYLIESNDSVIENNTMIYTYNLVSTYAIYLEDSNHTTVYDNIIDLNTGGTNGVPLNIRVKVSSGKIRGHNNITGNNLTANSASSFAYGIYLDNAGTSDYNTVQSNTLDLTSHNTEYGIYLYNSYGDSMDFNTIQSNDLRINATDSFAYGIKLENDGPSMDFNIVGSNTVDLTASSTALGISLSNFDTSNSNLFQSNDLRISSTSLRAYGITLEDFGTSQSHTLLNNNVTYYGNEISKAINDGSGTGDTNYLIYNNSFGEIRWTSSDFLTNLTVFENMTFGEHIIIGNNTVYLNSNYYVNDTSINSSANVTLQLSGWSFSNPEIKKDGVACSDCYNFTSLSASTVVFNVSSWSNYSVGERPNTAPNVTSVVLNTTDISLNDTNQNLTCYATGIDSEGDNLYYSGMWLKNGSEHVMVENVWNETIGGSDYDSMAGVVADSLGNVYAAGSTKSFGGSDTDVWIVKYDSDGNHIWNTTWGGTNTDNTRGMTIDSSDNIYVIGYSLSFGGGDRDFLVIKYNSEGVALWNRTMGAAASDDGNDVVTDSLGNVYATGDTMSFGAGNTDVWTIKMDSDGNHVWNKTIGGGNWEGGRGITIDASNNLYITGHTQSFGAGSDDVWTIKYDADGNVIWNRTLGGNESDYGYDITTDSAGQVYITGKTESFGSGSSNVWTIKYDTDGNHVWNTTFGGSANVGKGIISDSFDNIYIGGNGPGYDVLTIKYDSEGNQIWNITKGVDLYSCSGNGIAKDNYGNIYVAGSYAVAFNSYDGWTIKYQDGFTLSNQTQGEQVLVDTIDLSNTTTSDIWSCKIKVYDGSAESSVVSSANLTIMDTSPSCSDANPSGDLNCSGESITYTEDVVVNVSANYTDSNITAQKITITSNAVVVYDSVVLYVDDLIIEEGGYLEFRNGGQTVWHNGDWNISGTVLTNHETHRINVSIDGEFGINVLGGNFTIMNGTNITNGESATAEYYFNVLGNFSLENSFVSEMISNGINLRSGSSINELGNISFYDNLGFALSLGEDISLSGDLNVDGSCFNITADDVILDLNGYNITGSDNGAYRGIQAIGKDNITIMDGLIEWFGKSVFDGAGIFLEYVDNSVIENIIISNNAYSLNLFSDSNNNNLYNITTTLNNGPGIYLQGNVNNNNFYNVISISNNDDGISLSNGPNNNSFYNTTINLNSDDGLKLISSSNNTFNNLNSYSNGGLEVNYISGEGNKMIYNNSYGQMSFIDDLDYDIEGTLRIGPGYNIEIGNNSAYLNSSGDISELNKSANVSLELTGWSFSNPVIYRNSVEVCNSTTTPACHNFTSLSASTVVFNVTSWSNYSIGEAPFDPSLYFTFQINTSKASGTTFSFTADNYNNFDIIWGDGNSNTSLSGNGLIAHTYAGEGVYNVSVKGYTNRIMFFDQFFTGKQNMLVDILTNVSNGVSGINSTYRMFEYTSNFGKTPLTEPAFFDDVSGDVTYMAQMFMTSQFNQSISNWNVSSVTDMGSMFWVSQFNQPIPDWDVSSVTDMNGMFAESQFNQDIGSWNVSSVTDMEGMFSNAQLSVTNYDSLLTGWASLSPALSDSEAFDAGSSQYCTGLAGKIILNTTHSWTITDGGKNCTGITDLIECGIIDSSGTYTVQNDINATDVCFNITSDNVILNGAGFTIDGDSTGTDYGVYTNGYNNLTIKNFGNIKEFIRGIYLIESNDSVIENNTMVSTYADTTYAIYLVDSNHTTVYDNVIEWNTTAIDKISYGVYIYQTVARGYNNITENNLTIHSLKYAYGIYQVNYGPSNFNTIQSNRLVVISLYAYGLYLSNEDTSNFNTIQSNTMNVNGTLAYGVYLNSQGISSNTLLNNNLSCSADILHRVIEDRSGAGDTNYLVYNNNFGEIRWTASVFLTNLDVVENITFGEQIIIGNNTAYLNSDYYVSDKSINSSANITLYNMNLFSFTNPAILKDNVLCSDCYNFTALNASTVVFNVSSWSNYSIGETPNTAPNVTSVVLNTTDVSTNDTTQNLTCYATGTDTDSDNLTYYGKWKNGSNYYSDLNHLDNDDQGGYAYGVWGDGNFIYLANHDNGIEVYSVNTTGGLTHIDNDDQGGNAFGVWGDGNFIYLANYDNGIEVYSVNTTGGLTHIDHDDQGGYANGVWGDGNFIYLANSDNGIEVYSVNTTGGLTHIDHDDQGGYALGVWGDENFIYLANYDNGIEVYSVDTTGGLTHIDNDDQGGYAYGVWGDGNFIYLANSANGIEVYSVNATGGLTHIDNDDQGGYAYGVWGDGNFIYLANYDNGIEVYSVNTTGGLTHIDHDDQGGYAYGVWGDENFIYLANYDNGIEVYSNEGSFRLSNQTQGEEVLVGTLGSSITTASENWSCSVKAYDGVDYSSYLSSGNVTILDIDAPVFTNLANQSILNNETLIYDIDATDVSGIDTFTVNDSNFVINSTGYLTNATVLTIGTYYLNISVNDTIGNVNSGVINVEVNESNTAPNITSVVLNTTDILTNDTTQNLTGYVVASDVDSDNITYAYNWYKNGTLNATSLITDGLVSYWPLDNDVEDYWGGNDGTNSGATLASGKVNGSYSFDGSDNNIFIEDTIGLNSTEVTASIWIKSIGDTTNRRFLTFGSTLQSRYVMGIQSGEIRTYDDILNEGQTDIVYSSFENNRWYYYVTVFNSNGSKYIYLDGEWIYTDENGGSLKNLSATKTWIGSQIDDNYWNGSIDEVLIYNRSLTAAEIKQIYDGSKAGGHTMNSSQTSIGDNWTLGVRGLDYSSIGDEVNSSSVLILNSVPLVSQVILNTTSSTNDTTQNLTGYVVANDFDSDNITYAYNWYKNGTLNATSLITDGLVAYYPLNNDTLDYYGDNVGVCTNCPTKNINSYAIGGAYSFDGVNDKLVYNSANLDSSEGITISIWIKAKNYSLPSVNSCDSGIIASRDANVFFNGGWSISTCIYNNARKAVIWFSNSSNTTQLVMSSQTEVMDDKWHYLVGTFISSGNISLYVDGQMENTSIAAPYGEYNTSSIYISTKQNGNGSYFNGSIDEVMIFNRTLNKSEIQQLYWAGVAKGHTMNSSQTTVGDSWKLGVRGLDDQNIGDEVNSSSVLILNSVPLVSQVILNTTSSTNDTTQNLTGYVIALDVDFDNVTYAYNWYKNGTLNATSLITDGLVGYWPLDNDVMDYWGSNDGINNGTTRNVAGKVGGTYELNGSNYIDCGNDSSLNIPREITVSFWAKPFSLGPWETMIGKNLYNAPTDLGSYIFKLDGSLNVYLFVNLEGGSNIGIQASNYVPFIDEWNYFAFTFNGSTANIYMNGTLIGTQSVPTNLINITNNVPLTFGVGKDHEGNLEQYFFNGSIDEVMVFNRSLTSTEIQRVYVGGITGGNILNPSQTTVGDSWKLGVRGLDYSSIGDEVNSSSIEILNYCGNNIKEGNETCDGDDHGGLDCSYFGSYTGTPTCDSSCSLTQTGCTATGGGGDSCTDSCTSSESPQCSGSYGYQTCGNYDNDNCLEWGSTQDCGTTSCSAAHTTGSCDNTCSEGSCGSCTPSSCSCESGWNDCNDDMGDGCETSGACEECSSDSDCDAGYGCQGGSCVECTCENQGDYCKDDTYPDSCNNADACTGTKLDTVWSPDTSTECIGTPFTQRGLDCAQTKESSGTLDPDCDGRVCGDAPNGCGTCSTGCSGNLLCNSEGQCEEPPACTGDGDCDNYDKDYCSGSVWMHKEGVCSDQNECGIGTESIVQDCSSELYYFQDPNIYLTEGICTELTLTEAKCDTTTKVAHYCEDNNVCTNNDYSEDPWSCTNSPNDAAIYGTKTKTCASGILSCTQTCSGGSMVDCTLDDCCDGVICEELTETCDDGSTRSCSPSCSGDGSCGSCTISCPEGEKEVAEQYADDSDKSKFACMNVTRSVEANQLSTKTIEFDERLVPKGYSIVMDPFNMGCNGEDVEFTVAIPDTFVDVQILKCKGDDCSAKETKTVTELWCEGEFVESVKEETRLLSPNLIPVKITPKKVDISELKQSIESGDNKIKFSEGFEGAVTLSMPSTVIEEAQNPYLKIIGSPVVLEFESSVKEGIETDLTVPYLITEKYDEDSLAIYGKLESGWKFIESSVDKQNGLVYSNVENIAEFIINNQATFALMGILRSTEFESKLERAYYPEQDTKDLIILVHGTASSPKTFQGIIDDISFSDQNIALYTLRYSLANSIDEIANEFSNLLETRTQEFDNIHIIAHSAGGIITQQALRESYDNSAEFIEKIGKVILVATPNEGSPIAEVYKNLFNELINEESDNPVFSINSQSIDDLIKGRIIPRVPDIDYYVIAGTREFSIKIPFFDDTSDLFEGETSDGVVTTESASHIGDSYIANKCENYWEIHLTHNDLIGDPLARKVIENIIAKEILKTESLLGKSNYYELDIENCDSAETYVVIGKEILLEEVEDVSFCNCGNGVCGVGEDAFNCPEDCAFFLSDIKDKGTLLILGYVVLILIMLILSIKAIKYVYIIHYLEKKSSKVKEKIKFNDYIKSVEICINKHEIVQGFKILNRVQKRLLVLKHFVSKKEFKQYKSKFKILSDSIKHLKNTNKNLFYDQLEAETKRIRQSKKRVCITVEKKGAKGYLNKRLCNTKEVLSLEKIKLFFELPHLELFFRFKPASKNHIERNIKFLFGKIKRYEDHITYRPKRNAYLVKMFVMYSKVYSKLISSKIDTKEKENLSKKLKIIHRNLKRLQREKPKPLLKERLKKLKPLDVEIKHISAEDLRKRVQKITSKIKKYEIDLIEEKKVSKNYSLKLFKEYVRIYSNISMSDVIKKDILIKPLKKVYRKIRSIQTTRLDEKVPPVPKSLKKYNLDPKRQRKDLIKRYDVLKKKINKRLKSGEQFKLFMEYSRLYSDLAHSSIEGDERIRFYDKLEKLNKKLKRFGDNGKD